MSASQPARLCATARNVGDVARSASERAFPSKLGKKRGRGIGLPSLGRIAVHLALAAITLIWLAPSLGLLITSLRHAEDIYGGGWWTAFGQWRFTLDNYAHILSSQGTAGNLGYNFVNSFLITVPATILPLAVACLAGYAFAWVKFWGRDWVFLVIVALMIVPQQMTFVPMLRMFNPLGLTASFVGIWLAHTAFALPLPIYMFRNSFISLPRDLIEYARIDGASEFTIATRIVIPLSTPTIASYAIFQFLWVWNDLLVSMVVLQQPRLQPLTVAIQALVNSLGAQWDLLSAAAFLVMTVPLVVFFGLQRYFVRGLAAGAVKG